MFSRLPKIPSMNLIDEPAERKWWLPFFTTIVIFMAAQMAVAIILAIILVIYIALSQQPNTLDNLTELTQATLLNLFTFAIPLIVLLVIFKFFNKQPLAALGFVKTKLVVNYLVGLALGAIGLLLVLGLCLLFNSASVSLSQSTNWLMIVLLFLGFMVQGMTEEVFFRGYLMNLVGHRKNATIAIVGNSILFGLFHGANPNISLTSLINLILFGFVFSLLFYLTENLWVVGAAHTIWNFMLGPVFGINVSGQNLDGNSAIFTTTLADKTAWLNGGSFGLEGGLACTLIGLLAIGLLLFLIQKKLSKQLRNSVA
ncbi:CPBP family intramembrane glutamic endopeptidase [Enterococcus sp. HY326]|uniref:CPBP family intramembrane glutamic endopeptidase n=1 Tax=Enterococcus sp. HY326 TaxID=2971265 RepID=UPI00223F2CC2|nr:CPBP family intramembrane glutamic endopeptidase [Enterococcus sp. HY326]